MNEAQGASAVPDNIPRSQHGDLPHGAHEDRGAHSDTGSPQYHRKSTMTQEVVKDRGSPQRQGIQCILSCLNELGGVELPAWLSIAPGMHTPFITNACLQKQSSRCTSVKALVRQT
eukprot:scaffold225696_cov19-Tisochrysis_lutea.AAC.1